MNTGVATLIAACSSQPQLGTLPQAPAAPTLQRLAERPAPDKKVKGMIFASELESNWLFGYADPNKQNKPASCTLGTNSQFLDNVQGFGSDSKGDLEIPSGVSTGNSALSVFEPRCGALVWRASVLTGFPVDAYSSDPLTGNVAVALTVTYNSFGYGGVVLCSKASGCGGVISNPEVNRGFGVALAENGDCWLSATGFSENYLLVYFQGCSGTGTVATGTQNAQPGGLFIDTKGNLAAIDQSGKLYVYSGCNPNCSLVSTSTLNGEPYYGGLDAKGTHFAVGDYATGGVDVYNYSPTSGATYSYSFNNGLNSGRGVEGAHFAPTNKEE